MVNKQKRLQSELYKLQITLERRLKSKRLLNKNDGIGLRMTITKRSRRGHILYCQFVYAEEH